MDLNKLDNMFNEKKDSEISHWNPQKQGDMIVGSVIRLGTSESFNTPYMIIRTLEGNETTVYVKSGAMSFFFNKNLVSSLKDGAWLDTAENELKDSLIAFRYEGQKKNPNTSRFFQSFKVLFAEELKALNIVNPTASNPPAEESTPAEPEISPEEVQELINAKIKDSDNTISEKAAKTLVAKDLGLKVAKLTEILKKKD